MVTTPRDDDLTLFHAMRRENEKNGKIHPSGSAHGEAYLAPRSGNSSLHRPVPPSQPVYKREDLLASDAGKNDYDWLLTPPGTPLMTASEHNPASMDFKGLPTLVKSLDTMKISRGLPTNAKTVSLCRAVPSKLGRSNLYTCASAPTKRVSSCSAPASRPTSRTAPRSTTPTRGPASAGVRFPSQNTMSVSRSSTPLRRPLQQSQSPQPAFTRPSPALKPSTGPPSKSTPSSRGSSPNVRTRTSAWELSSMPGFSLEPPPNLRTTASSRSLSGSRGACVGISQNLSSSSSLSTRVALSTVSSMARIEPAPSNSRVRRQSCSPSINRGRSTPERPGSDGKRDSSPAVQGNGMVEKLIQSRRAAASNSSLPDAHAVPLKTGVRPPTPTKKDVEWIGRNLTRRSMDMALRHMDLRQSASNGLRSIAPGMYPPSLYTVRSITGRGLSTPSLKTTTSSTASSEHSVSFVCDVEGGSEMGDDLSSDVGSKASPMSLCDSVYSATKDLRWSSSPDYRDDSVELMKLFRQGIKKLSGSDSPLVCPHGGGGLANCNLCNVKNRLQSLSNNMRTSLHHSADVSKGNSPFSSSSKSLSSPSPSMC